MKHTLLVLGGVVVLAPATVRAQQDTVRLEDIVVTATRVPLPRASVAASVTVLAGTALREQGFFTVADALRSVAGVAMVGSGSFGSQTALFLRGGESNYTQVLVDGVAVNTPGGSYDFANLTLDDVERIEIVRGPASVLYGSDAVSGVIQIFTRNGGAAGAGASVVTGSYGTVKSAADVHGMGWSVGASGDRTDGLLAYNNQWRNLAAAGAARLALDRRTSVRLTARTGASDYHYPTDASGNLVDANQHQTAVATTVGMDVARRLSGRGEARLTVGYHRVGSVTDDRPDGSGDTVGFYAYRGDGLDERRSADMRVTLDGGMALFTVGGAATMERERSSAVSESSYGPFSTAYDTTRANGAVYGQITMPSIGSLAVNAGVRLDRNQRFGTFVTARGGAVWRVAPDTRLRGTIGTAFKEPTFFENYGGGFVVGNPDLHPERTLSWDVGAERSVAAGRAWLSATWFSQRFRDLIEYVGTAAPGEPNYANVAGARANGLELQASASPSGLITVSGQATWLFTKVTEAGSDPTFVAGERLVRRPSRVVALHATLTPASRLRVTAGVRHIGTRDDLDYSVVDYVAVFDPNRVTLPATTLLDASAESLIGAGFTLRVSVANLLGVAYQEILGFAAPGRTFQVGARMGMGS